MNYNEPTQNNKTKTEVANKQFNEMEWGIWETFTKSRGNRGEETWANQFGLPSPVEATSQLVTTIIGAIRSEMARLIAVVAIAWSAFLARLSALSTIMGKKESNKQQELDWKL